MNAGELISKLSKFDPNDTVVIVIEGDEGAEASSEMEAYDIDFRGHDGWDNTIEIHLGDLVSG